MYSDKGFHCDLINGYAYDTTLEWLKKDNNVELLYIEDSNIYTGRNSVKNVYDMFDNVFEYTSEKNYDTIVIRGVLEKDFFKEESRYTIMESDKFFGNNFLTARVIIYK